jgi:hypothetical protein
LLIAVFCLLALTAAAACKAPGNAKTVFGLTQFEQGMKSAHYRFTVEDADRFFLPAAQKHMKIGRDTLTIYLFPSAAAMEATAKGISGDGSIYSDGNTGVCVDYTTPPHLYKKGSIIVQYGGGNARLTADLKKLLGAQFAGG